MDLDGSNAHDRDFAIVRKCHKFPSSREISVQEETIAAVPEIMGGT